MPFGEHNTWDFFPRHLYRAEVMDPHMAIRDFFQRMDLPGYLKDLDDWFQSACAYTCTLQQQAIDFLCLYEDMEKLIEAAWLMQQGMETGEAEGAAPVSRPEMQQRLERLGQLYLQHRIHPCIWDYFPRHLRPAELMNPALVFRDFFAIRHLPGWRDELKMLFEAGLSRNSVYESLGFESNLHTSCLYLKKLVEAAFLLFLEHEKAQPHDTGTLPACRAGPARAAGTGGPAVP